MIFFLDIFSSFLMISSRTWTLQSNFFMEAADLGCAENLAKYIAIKPPSEILSLPTTAHEIDYCGESGDHTQWIRLVVELLRKNMLTNVQIEIWSLDISKTKQECCNLDLSVRWQRL